MGRGARRGKTPGQAVHDGESLAGRKGRDPEVEGS